VVVLFFPFLRRPVKWKTLFFMPGAFARCVTPSPRGLLERQAMILDTISPRRWRSGSVFAAGFRRIDRNQRAKIMYLAEAMDRRTKQPGKHGGFLGRPALAVLRALMFTFHNRVTGQLDPSIATLARAANVARSTAQAALDRLELCGIIERVRRMARQRVRIWSAAAQRHVWANCVRQISNAYRVNFALPDRAEHGDLSRPQTPDTGKRSETNPVIILPAERPALTKEEALANWEKRKAEMAT
jgi:DNA-binding MarR family transcriptional regulator